jgi:hypothetical protein
MGDLQTPASPRNTRPITRNEQVSGSSPLVGSPKNAVLQVNYESHNFLSVQAESLLIPLRNRTGKTLCCGATPGTRFRRSPCPTCGKTKNTRGGWGVCRSAPRRGCGGVREATSGVSRSARMDPTPTFDATGRSRLRLTPPTPALGEPPWQAKRSAGRRGGLSAGTPLPRARRYGVRATSGGVRVSGGFLGWRMRALEWHPGPRRPPS